MYQREDQARSGRRGPDGPGRIAPEDRARHALARIEQALSAAPAGLALDRERLRAALQTPLADPALEQQRRFALGWLEWLDGHFSSAMSLLRAVEGARAAYWRTRVSLLAGQQEAVTAYEQALRTFQGSPQATVWFVELLWRSGQQERAAQVWKSLRMNKRIKDCEEAVFLEARALLAQGDVASAEPLLRAANLQSPVLRAERLLLLTWCLLTMQKTTEAVSRLEGAATGLFPVTALAAWRTLARRDVALPSWEQLRSWPLSPPARAWIEAQRRRLEGGASREVGELLSRTAGATVLTPFAGYVRASLGLVPFAALSTGFLGPRCRLWLTLTRFCRGTATAAETRTALQQAQTAGYSAEGLAEWVSLVHALAEETSTPEQLWTMPGLGGHNSKRAALEMGLRRWTDGQALPVLLRWAREAPDDAPLRQRLGRALLRLVARGTGDEAALTAAQALLPEGSLTALLAAPRPPTSPPPGVDPVLWFLHQASSALGREDDVAALAWVRRATEAGLDTLDESRCLMVEAARPLLDRRARAQRLADMARFSDAVPPSSPALFVELSDLLHDLPEGRALFETAELGQAREHLMALAGQQNLSARLAHHLALIFYRAARHIDAAEDVETASLHWLRSWRCWLKAGRTPDEAELLFDHLLGLHRVRLEDLLTRGDVSRAKVVWELVLTALPKLLGDSTESLRLRLQRFRDDLAAAFLLDVRESMRHGAIPEGWRCDYEQGLNRLRRLLSLDRDNPHLLTAVVEICADWFLDLYELPDEARLKQEVDRYTPFALQLGRAMTRAGRNAVEELQTRAALSEFFKFRAFVADDPERKRALYREALTMNPANDNVRDILGGLEGPTS